MYTEEEIKSKFKKTTNNVKKAFLIGHRITRLILQDRQGQNTEKEYFEGLIFTSFFILAALSTKKNVSSNETMTVLFQELIEYCMEEIENLGDILDDDIGEFLNGRFTTIGEEISKMSENENYMIPFLINNLYADPLNKEKTTIQEIHDKIGGIQLIQLALTFKAKYTKFLGALRQALQLLENH